MQKKVAEILPIQAMNLPALLPIQAMKLPSLLTIQAMKLEALLTPLPHDQVILLFMALVKLLCLPLTFVYFFHTTPSLKIKNKLMKNRVKHQNDFICFRPYIINE